MLSAALLFIVFALLLLVTATIRNALNLSGDLERQLRNELTLGQSLLRPLAGQNNPQAMRQSFEARMAVAPIKRMAWRDSGGATLELESPPVAHLPPAWFVNALAVTEPVGSTSVVDQQGKELGSLVVAVSASAGTVRLWADFLSSFHLLALAMGLQFVGIALLLYFGLRPLRALTAGARQLGAGDLATRIKLSGSPEVRHTIVAFNRMAESLESTLTELQRGREELRIAATAFDSEEAMAVTDAEQRILRVNRAFVDITGYAAEEVMGKTPRILLSSDHDDGFYRQTWLTVSQEKYWQGEIWSRHKLGRVYPIWQTISAVVSPEGHVSHYVLGFNDISQRKEAEEKIRNLAFFDSLTQLPNRRQLIDKLGLALAAAARYHHFGALLFLDLDYFKVLNDTEGHDAGDQLLIELARRLRSCVREGDTVARLGGDEFIVMLSDVSADISGAAEHAEVVGNKILEAVSRPFAINGHDYRTTLSIGICLFDDKQSSVDELLKRADVAMYQAKLSGRNTLRFFDPVMQEALVARATMESELRRAVSQKELRLYYQPQLNDKNHVLGAEALVRWQHPVKGLLPPEQFIPLAEETGIILTIGRWVLETAVEQLVRWAQDQRLANLVLSVNISARQFREADFVDSVRALLDKSGANPERLKFELTESVIIDDMGDTIAKMKALKSLGIGFSMDDFGTGYSSLSYLRRLPLDQLKIDRSFVSEVETSAGDAVIVQTIIAMAHSLGLNIIAEGVENEGQRQFLNRHDCPVFQGYLFSEPVPVADFEILLAKQAEQVEKAE